MGCMDSGGSESKSTSKTKTQTKAIDAGIGTAPEDFPGYASYFGGGQPSYPGQRVASFTGTQQGVFDQLPEFANMFGDLSGSPLQKQLESTSGKLLGGELGAQPITPEQESSFFNRAIRDPRQREFQQTEAPLIREEFAGPGFYGSARAKEVAEAQGDINAQLSGQRGQLAFDVLGRNQQIEESSANRALNAINPSLAVGRAPTQQALGQLGGLAGTLELSDTERVQQQAEINANMQKFFEENQITDPQVMEALAMLLGQNVSVSSGSSSGPGLGYVGASSAMSSFGSTAGGNLAGTYFPAPPPA